MLTYNLHKGFAPAGRRFVLDVMREAVESTAADVVFLQEVLGEHRHHAQRVRNWIDAAQFEYLADRLWDYAAYGRNAVYEGGHHGNAILSKYPILSWDNIDLSVHSLERRGVLHAVIHPHDWPEPLHLLCTHLDLTQFTRRLQIARIADRISAHVPESAPLILAGDFNDWRGRIGHLVEDELGLAEAHKQVHGSCARTFPARLPILRLDRIYLRGLRAVSAERLSGPPWQTLSDHCAVLADLVRR